MIRHPELPAVLKIAWPHAGYGKIRIRKPSDFTDVRSVVALHADYVIAEPLIDSEYEVRIVFIAPDYYRVHQRRAIGWKVNMDCSQIREDMDINSLYKLWCDEVHRTFGLDIFAIDGIVDKDGRQFILEVNGTIGLCPEHEEQCHIHMSNLIASKLRGYSEEVEIQAVGELENEDGLRRRIEDFEQKNACFERTFQFQNREIWRLRFQKWWQSPIIFALVFGLVIGWIGKFALGGRSAH
jgi:hypothetical protein